MKKKLHALIFLFFSIPPMTDGEKQIIEIPIHDIYIDLAGRADRAPGPYSQRSATAATPKSRSQWRERTFPCYATDKGHYSRSNLTCP